MGSTPQSINFISDSVIVQPDFSVVCKNVTVSLMMRFPIVPFIFCNYLRVIDPLIQHWQYSPSA